MVFQSLNSKVGQALPHCLQSTYGQPDRQKGVLIFCVSIDSFYHKITFITRKHFSLVLDISCQQLGDMCRLEERIFWVTSKRFSDYLG